ncbi:MAG TPA: hypothetical protein VEU33_02120, partial [Archangium sp.]|nr:hypothetical protein [Archangium sp.]
GVTLSGQGNFTAGVSQAEQRMALTTTGSTDTLLYAVRSNADDTTKLMGPNGKLIITFNRPVEIAPGTTDCQVATASNPDTDGDGRFGRLITDVRNNPPTTYSTTSESVSVEISSDGLTLTIGFRTEAGFEFDPDDRGTTIRFSGILVRPRGTSENSQVRYIGSAASCPAASSYSYSMMQNLRTNSSQPDTIQLL